MSTDLVEQADPAQRLAACEAALLSMTEKRDEWQFKANDIGHDGKQILWSDKWSEMLSEYKSELSDRRAAEASLGRTFAIGLLVVFCLILMHWVGSL